MTAKDIPGRAFREHLIWPAPAKLNLMLHITGRREDGYHELQTVFQFIDVGDELQFRERNDGQLVRHGDDYGVSAEEDIILRAAICLKEAYQQKFPETPKTFGADITIKKNIPLGAGLGGGSSDAATTLLVLNVLWNTGLSLEELAAIGLKLGADVPVFVHGFAAFAEGVGEKLAPISPPEDWYLVVIPPVHVSTSEVFLHPELTRDCSAIKICDLSRHEWRNVCTPVVKKSYPLVSQAIDIVGKYSKAKMSGTGASVFATFENKKQADQILQKIRETPGTASWICFVAEGMNKSPVHQLLGVNPE